MINPARMDNAAQNKAFAETDIFRWNDREAIVSGSSFAAIRGEPPGRKRKSNKRINGIAMAASLGGLNV